MSGTVPWMVGEMPDVTRVAARACGVRAYALHCSSCDLQQVPVKKSCSLPTGAINISYSPSSTLEMAALAVVATYHPTDLLLRTLAGVRQHYGDFDIVVLTANLEDGPRIRQLPERVVAVQTFNAGRELGQYAIALRHFPLYEVYLFMQDSTVPVGRGLPKDLRTIQVGDAFSLDVQNFNGPRVEDWIASVRYMGSTIRRGSSQTKGQRTQLSFRATILSRLVATSRRRLSLRLTILTRRDGTRRSHVQSWTAGSLREQLHS